MRSMRLTSHLLAILVVSAAGFLAAGCSMFSGTDDAPAENAENVEGAENTENTENAENAENAENVENVERADTQIFVGDTLEMNYDPNVIMKRAESFHEKEGYAEAIVEYQHFLDLHRSHVLAPYAQYRLALSHFKMVGTIDRDITPAKRARRAFVDLMTEFPASPYEAEALATIRQCDRHLAQHHLFVGTFYYHKEAYMAAAKRFRTIVTTYPDTDEAVEATLYLSKTYKAIGALEWSRDWAVALVRRHPRHALRNEGLDMLAALHNEHPDLAETDSVNPNTLITSLVPMPATHSASLPSSGSQTVPPFPASAASGFHAAAGTPCRVGSWCGATETTGAEGVSPNTIPTPPSPGTPTVTCRPGAWCE